MKVKILGCSGSEAISRKPPGFLVNDVLMLDAGTITTALNVDAQSRITDILISHSHLDHIKAIAFLADNIIGRITKPVNICSTAPVLDAIRTHLMNNIIWPDFTKIPSADAPVLAYRPIEVMKPFTVAELNVMAIPMKHPVPATGFLVSDAKSSILYSGDTGPNKVLWEEAAKAKNLKAIMVDTSFPNSMDFVAKLSGHYTPQQLHDDLVAANLNLDVPIYCFHIKPAHQPKVLGELRTLGLKNVMVLQEGETYDF